MEGLTISLITLPTLSMSNFFTGPSIPRARLLRIVSDLPNPTRNSIFQFSSPPGLLLLGLASLGSTVGTRPRCCTPIKISFDCYPDASRHSHSCSMNRYSHSRTKHRHSHSHCCAHDKPHGLLGSATLFFHKNTIFNTIIKTVSKKIDGLTPVWDGDHHSGDHRTLCRFAPVDASRYLDYRLVRRHACRFHDFAAEGQTRADIRIRVR